MKYLFRLFKHIWPQWHRVLFVFLSAITIAIFFSLSFMTLVPILKVMMSQEGLHGYVNRKICSDRYGAKFQVLENTEYMDPNQSETVNYLQVVKIKKDSLAEKAGLRQQDYVVGVSLYNQQPNDKQSSLEILTKLAFMEPQQDITIKYQRLNKENNLIQHSAVLHTGEKPFYLDTITKTMAYFPKRRTDGSMVKAILIIMLVAVFTIIRCVATFSQKYLANRITHTAINNLRYQIFDHTIKMPVSYFSKQKPSDAVSRLNRDIALLGIGVKILLNKALREPLKAICLMIFAMIIDLKLTLIFLLASPFILGMVGQLGKKMKRATKKSLISGSNMLAKLSESFSSVKIIKVYNQYDYENENFDKVNRSLLKQQIKIGKVDSATQPIMEVAGLAAGCAALLFGTKWVASGTLDASEFLALIVLLGAAAESIRKSSDIWNKVQQGNAAAERVYGLLDEPLENEKKDAVNLAPLSKSLQFKDVVFTYPNAENPVLKGVNLTIEAGHNIALVGPNGSGKTTLVNLLPRFYDVDSGAILIDNTDISDCSLFSLRNQMSLVTQQVVTFNDTISANIAYGKTGASMDEIIGAAKSAYAHEFIIKLPDGYETKIGEHGSGLSGGQLQRIVIARAIINNPQILIFDEATSQIDADSEAKIHKAIEELMHNRTSIIIAHRFSTVISADLIAVMDNGQIIARGKHEELMKKCSLYQSLYQTQLIKD